MEKNKAGLHNIVVDYTKETAKNFLMGIPAFRRWRLRRPRSSGFFNGTDEHLSVYAFNGLNMLLNHVGDVRGRSILEIGAGDYLTSGFGMLAAGASYYGVIDRFPGDYSGEAAKAWYKGMEEAWPRFYPDIPWAEGLRAEDFPDAYGHQLELIREPIETARASRQYDYICSFQVGEHISDLDVFADVNYRLMKPGGAAVHRVDFGPHDCWHYYRDPLTFLRFSDRMWDLTGSNRGTPNRRRHHEFVAAFERAGLSVEVPVLESFKEDIVDFSSLNPRFKTMSREDVLVGTAVYVLRRKP